MTSLLLAAAVLGSLFMTWRAVRFWLDPKQADAFRVRFPVLPFSDDARRGRRVVTLREEFRNDLWWAGVFTSGVEDSEVWAVPVRLTR
ncbi:hypothetical protein [Streptomyces sp. NPDC051561]|uniref:hypothetical protein n=1 Tax=Streptomyces sp. NPDC051561 TaxID=3365658 RepID=UPI0037A40265